MTNTSLLQQSVIYRQKKFLTLIPGINVIKLFSSRQLSTNKLERWLPSKLSEASQTSYVRLLREGALYICFLIADINFIKLFFTDALDK